MVLCSSVALATYNINLVPIDNRISIEEFALFNVTITNNLAVSDNYRIYTSDFPQWDVRTDPLSNPITLDVNSFLLVFTS